MRKGLGRAPAPWPGALFRGKTECGHSRVLVRDAHQGLFMYKKGNLSLSQGSATQSRPHEDLLHKMSRNRSASQEGENLGTTAVRLNGESWIQRGCTAWVQHTQITCVSIYSSKQSEVEIKTALPFITAPKRMNYLGIKLTKDRKGLYTKNNKTWIQDICKDPNKEKDIRVTELEDLLLLRCPFYLKPSPDSKQSLLQF